MIAVFRKYFADHADIFADAPEMQSGEHNLTYYGCFQAYLKLYEVGEPRTFIDVEIEIDIGIIYRYSLYLLKQSLF